MVTRLFCVCSSVHQHNQAVRPTSAPYQVYTSVHYGHLALHSVKRHVGASQDSIHCCWYQAFLFLAFPTHHTKQKHASKVLQQAGCSCEHIVLVLTCLLPPSRCAIFLVSSITAFGVIKIRLKRLTKLCSGSWVLTLPEARRCDTCPDWQFMQSNRNTADLQTVGCKAHSFPEQDQRAVLL